MNNLSWADRISRIGNEATASGDMAVACALKSLAGALYAGMEDEFARRAAEFSRMMIIEIEKSQTSGLN